MKNYLKILSGSSNPALAQEICDYLAIVPARRQIIREPNDNIKVKIEENVREDDVFVIQTSASPVNHRFVELLLLIMCAPTKRTNPAFLLPLVLSPTCSKQPGPTES